MKSAIVNRNAWALGIATACLAIAVVFACVFYQRLVVGNRSLVETHRLIECLRQSADDLQNIEIGGLGYVTTQDKSFLTLLRANHKQLEQDIKIVSDLVSGKSQQKQNVTRLVKDIQAQREVIAEIESNRFKEPSDVAGLHLLNRFKELLTKSHADLSCMLVEQQNLRAVHYRNLQRAQRVILIVIAIFFALTFVSLIAVFVTTRAFAVSQEAGRHILEKAVKDRTAELRSINEELKRSEENLTARVRERTIALEQSNQQLEIARDKALDASKMKSQFVATISHELRTPMGGVLGMAELLLDCPLDEQAREFAQRIFDSANQLLTVLNDLLDFSKLEVGKVHLEQSEFSIISLVANVTGTVDSIAKHKHLFLNTTIMQDVPPIVFGDQGRNRQILLNLVHNALKFTDSGGVSISVAVVEQSAQRVRIRFSVTDTGIGITPDVQETLFQPFVQAHSSTTSIYGGTGLGLSISKDLVQLMSGSIGVNSQKGEGSMFWYEVPFQASHVFSEPVLSKS